MGMKRLHRPTWVRYNRFMAMLIVCLTVAAISVMPLAKVFAADDVMSAEDRQAWERAQAQIKELNSQTDALVKQQNEISAQQQNILGDMKRLSAQIAVLQGEIKALDGQIAWEEDNIAMLDAAIDVRTAQVEERTAYLNQRLNQIYIDGEMTLLDVLFVSTSLSDFLTRYDLMSKVVENDVSLLEELKELRRLLEEEKYAIEVAKAGLEAEKLVREEKRAELNSQWTKENAMVQNLAIDKQALEAAENELNALSKELDSFIKSIQAKYQAAYMGSGTMGWPLPGHSRISSPYGYRQHPILGGTRFHSGIDIPAPRETPILACETGKVIMATTYGGYGNTVILDHGGGVASQYGHMNSISVSVGDIVTKGSKIGGVGTTGLSTGNHLHFEIRVDGATVDPLGHPTYYVVQP